VLPIRLHIIDLRYRYIFTLHSNGVPEYYRALKEQRRTYPYKYGTMAHFVMGWVRRCDLFLCPQRSSGEANKQVTHFENTR
jgi:hypothetical protein